ncbi:hypothetical protein A9G13_09015 [Gilliamella sp. wkB178]|uniref:histidine-type phosphatase n=1 Tax=Gilliamella sp. wkB178 TaxID=3120259 RepID=UPI00080D94ED|nr:histidine-type phosphatase [Gilliamella apicola]OCG07111.1 hypothetical protein A9G13_09015 [Gilliamella apicola]
MNNSNKLFFIVLFLFSSMSFAQQMTVSGSKTSYQYDTKQKLTSVPKGYQAFYIDHIGRHGSRYISKAKYEDIAYNTLLLAEKEHQLTDMGKELLRQIAIIIQLNKNHYGELTDLGRQDISFISQRMLANNPSVFKGQKLDVMASSSPRAKESAKIFIQVFSTKYPNIQIMQQPDDEQTLLRFFDYSPNYKAYKNSKAIKNEIKSLEHASQTIQMSDEIAKKIFTYDFSSRLANGIEIVDFPSIKTDDFAIAIYQLYQELLAFPPQVLVNNNLDLSMYFSTKEQIWFDTVVGVKNYLQIGPAFDNNGIQIKIAAPLLWNMIHTADAALADQKIDANLRFAHAETISPLATLLEIEGTRNVTDNLSEYPSVWHADKIIPMGANIQWIFYRSREANQPVLVKVLLNEQEVKIPVATNNYPYYRWQDVKQFYVNKLNKLGLKETQNPLKMLKTLQ